MSVSGLAGCSWGCDLEHGTKCALVLGWRRSEVGMRWLYLRREKAIWKHPKHFSCVGYCYGVVHEEVSMPAHTPDRIEVRDGADHVEVVGLSVQDVQTPSSSTGQWAAQTPRSGQRWKIPQSALLTSGTDLPDHCSPASSAADGSFASTINDESGYETHETRLARLRDSGSARYAPGLHEPVNVESCFTVKVEGVTLIPEFSWHSDETQHQVPRPWFVRWFRWRMNGPFGRGLPLPPELLSGEVPVEAADGSSCSGSGLLNATPRRSRELRASTAAMPGSHQ